MRTAGILLAFLILPSLFAGQETARVAVSLEAPVPVPENALRVLVVDPTGGPIAGAVVGLREIADERDAPPQGATRLASSWRKKTHTDPEGCALFQELAAGSYRLAAGAMPSWTYHSSAPVEPGCEVTIALSPIPAERALTGRVLEPDGMPRRGAIVYFVWDDRGVRKRDHAQTDELGRFVLLADEPGRTGALLATVYQKRLRSRILDPIQAGTGDIDVRLGAPRFMTLQVRSSEGGAVENATARFSWYLDGSPFLDYPGPQRIRGAPIRWELPEVPFHVSVSAPDHEPRTLGPLDPQEVGAALILTLQSHPRIRGRVTHAGVPVAGARVTLRSAGSRSGSRRRTDEDGRFDIPFTGAGTHELVAWSDEFGEGDLGPIELDPTRARDDELHELEITRAPGSISGRVRLPANHDPREIWLTTTRGHGYMRVEPDGAFLLPDLPSGPLTVRVLQGYDLGEFEPPISTSGTSRPAGQWFWISHGPERAPSWLPGPSTRDVEVQSGRTVELELDLTASPRCVLEGRVLLNGEAPPHEPRGRELYWDLGPRVTLHRGSSLEYVDRAVLDADGGFAIHANEPGEYVLEIDVTATGRQTLTFVDRVQLGAGPTTWTRDLRFGSVVILPAEKDGVVTPFEGELRWRGPGDFEVRAAQGETDETTRTVRYATVPAGTVQLVSRPHAGGTVLLETTVREAETTTVSCP